MLNKKWDIIMPRARAAEPATVKKAARIGIETAALLVVFIGAIFIYVPGMDDLLRFGLSDNNQYLFLAESLADGNGYRQGFSVHNMPETRIPPGHPLLLAAIIRVQGLDVPAMKVVELCFHFAAGFFFLLSFLRASRSSWDAIIGFTLGLICPLSVIHSRDISAETPYTLCAAFTIWLFVRSSPRSPSPAGLWLAGLAIAASIMFRIQGLALWLAAGAAVLMTGQTGIISGATASRLLKISAIPAAALFAWLLRNYIVTGVPGTDYIHWFMGVHPEDEMSHPISQAAFLEMVKGNIDYYTNLIYRLALPFERLYRPLPGQLAWTILAVAGTLWGLYRNLRTPQRIIGIYYALFALMIIGWVFQVDNYSTSTYFIIYWLMASGLNDLVFRRLGRLRPLSRMPRMRAAVPAAAALLWIAGLVYTDVKIIDQTIPNTVYPPMRVAPRYRVSAPVTGMEQMRMLMVRLKALDDKGIVMCHSPQHMARVLGRPCLNIPILPPKEMLDYMEKENVRFIMLDQMFPRTREFLLPVVQKYNERFDLLFTVGWPTPEDNASIWILKDSSKPGQKGEVE